jgi:hypothetical protein
MMHIVNNMMKFLWLYLFQLSNVVFEYKRNEWFNILKIKTIIFSYFIDNEINDLHLANFIINTTKIECYDLQYDPVIQSCNVPNKKSQTLEDENFTKS